MFTKKIEFSGKVALMLTLCISTLILTSNRAVAEVQYRDGSYETEKVDMVYWKDFEITRYYSSKEPEDGLFGWGWGLELHHLNFRADGSIEIKGCRSKGQVFVPECKLLKANTCKITNANLMPEGTMYVKLNSYSSGVIRKMRDGYFDTRDRSTFNLDGRLIRREYENGTYLIYSYNKTGRILKISDQEGLGVSFSYNQKERISRIAGKKDQNITYRYDNHGNLIQLRDNEGKTSTYKYDDRHRMITESVSSGKEIILSDYDDSDGRVKVSGNDVYVYSSDKNDPLQDVTTVFAKDHGADDEPLKRFDFIYEKNTDGSQWLRTEKKTVFDEITITEYDRFGKKVRVQTGVDATNYQYDKRNFIIREEKSNGTVREFEYHPQLYKVVKVKQRDHDNQLETKYAYNEKGLLINAKDSSGLSIIISYYDNGQISSNAINDTVINYKYASNGKPSEIAVMGVGKLIISYNEQGEVQDVKMAEGNKNEKSDDASPQKLAKKITESMSLLVGVTERAKIDI